jgi:hypothetical protein
LPAKLALQPKHNFTMSGSNHSAAYNHADKLEANKNGSATAELERMKTAGGHEDDRTQPSLPVVHRSFANPAPLGLLSFATGIFLISLFGVQVRGVATPNLLIGVLIFFGGVCQFISGIMEFISGNTVSCSWIRPRALQQVNSGSLELRSSRRMVPLIFLTH